MKPQEYLLIKKAFQKIIQKAYNEINDAKGEASKCPVPPACTLRLAVPEDIKKDAILWYPDRDDQKKWVIIEEVIKPKDKWKGFEAEDGCRYGYDGAYVYIL